MLRTMSLAIAVLLLSGIAAGAGATKTYVSGAIPGGGTVVDPGRMWISSDGIVHLRGQVITNIPVTGDLVGTHTIVVNFDWNMKEDILIFNNVNEWNVSWSTKGLTGIFRGRFQGRVRGGSVVFGKVVFQGSGGFAGMKMLADITDPTIPGPPGAVDYRGIILEPRGQ